MHQHYTSFTLSDRHTFAPLQNIHIHVLGITLFIIFEVSHLAILNVKLGLPDLLFYPLEIAFFYFSARFTYMRLIKQPDWNLVVFVGLALNVLLFTILYLVIKVMLDWDTFAKTDIDLVVTSVYLILHRGLYIMAAASCYWLVLMLTKKTEEAGKLELANSQAQVNPHEILNVLTISLNGVMGISERAEKLLLASAKVVRYALLKVEADGKVALDRELEQLKNTIELNRIRFNSSLIFFDVFEIAQSSSGLRIPANLLNNLLGNLFNHGDLYNTEYPATMLIHCTGNRLVFRTYNKKRADAYHNGSKMGLDNTRLRLQLMYRDTHYLQILEDDHFFILELTIDL